MILVVLALLGPVAAIDGVYPVHRQDFLWGQEAVPVPYQTYSAYRNGVYRVNRQEYLEDLNELPFASSQQQFSSNNLAWYPRTYNYQNYQPNVIPVVSGPKYVPKLFVPATSQVFNADPHQNYDNNIVVSNQVFNTNDQQNYNTPVSNLGRVSTMKPVLPSSWTTTRIPSTIEDDGVLPPMQESRDESEPLPALSKYGRQETYRPSSTTKYTSYNDEVEITNEQKELLAPFLSTLEPLGESEPTSQASRIRRNVFWWDTDYSGESDLYELRAHQQLWRQYLHQLRRLKTQSYYTPRIWNYLEPIPQHMEPFPSVPMDWYYAPRKYKFQEVSTINNEDKSSVPLFENVYVDLEAPETVDLLHNFHFPMFEEDHTTTSETVTIEDAIENSSRGVIAYEYEKQPEIEIPVASSIVDAIFEMFETMEPAIEVKADYTTTGASLEKLSFVDSEVSRESTTMPKDLALEGETEDQTVVVGVTDSPDNERISQTFFETAETDEPEFSSKLEVVENDATDLDVSTGGEEFVSAPEILLNTEATEESKSTAWSENVKYYYDSDIVETTTKSQEELIISRALQTLFKNEEVNKDTSLFGSNVLRTNIRETDELIYREVLKKLGFNLEAFNLEFPLSTREPILTSTTQSVSTSESEENDTSIIPRTELRQGRLDMKYDMPGVDSNKDYGKIVDDLEGSLPTPESITTWTPKTNATEESKDKDNEYDAILTNEVEDKYEQVQNVPFVYKVDNEEESKE